MAKKKQLAGKTTKLAKLPLTQALVEQSGEAGRRPVADASSQSPEPLGAVYLHVLRELTTLLSQLQAEPTSSLPAYRTFLPPQIPKPEQLRQSLRLAQQGLRDLQVLLAQA